MVSLKEYAKEHHVPIIQDEGLIFLLKTINDYRCKKILELGSAIGYSAIQMAKLDKAIQIVTIEKKEELYKEAQKNIKFEGLENRIVIHNMNIDDFETNELFDLIFVDAAKAQYGKYLKKFKKNLANHGVFFFDNLAFHGLVEHPELCKSRNTKQLVKKIKKFIEETLENPNYSCSYYPDIGDGIMILKIKENTL